MELKEFFTKIMGVYEQKYLDKLLDCSYTRRFKKTETIYKRGDVLTDFNILSEGAFYGVRFNEKGESIIECVIFEKGYPVLKSPDLSDNIIDLDVVALTDCEFACVNRQRLLALLKESEELWEFYKKMAEYSFEKHLFMHRLLLQDSEARVREFKKLYAPVEKFMNQEQVANYLGISRSTLNNVLKKLGDDE